MSEKPAAENTADREQGMERCEVLVVGSGEAGPVMAAELRKHGVTVLLTAEEAGVAQVAQDRAEIRATLTDESAALVWVRCSYLVDDRDGTWRDRRVFGITSEGDARNLAWKLAAVLRGAGEDLLDSYRTERAGGARHYRKSPLSQELGGKRLKLRAGDHVPDVRLWSPFTGGDVTLGAILAEPSWTLLGLGSKTAETVAAIVERFGAAVRAEVVGGGAGVAPGVSLQDRYGEARRTIARRGGTILVIRPDGYLGLRSGLKADIIAAYLEDLVPHRSE